MKIEGLKVNFLGDSITEGCGASTKENGFCHVFERRYGLAEARNYGIGGTRIARQKTPSEMAVYDRDFCARALEMDPDADLIVVFGGTNDYGHGDAPFGDKTSNTPDTFLGACRFLMRELIERYPAIPIVFLTPLHREGENNPRFDGHVLADFVQGICDVAKEFSVPVLDLYATAGILPDIAASKEQWTADGLHPNDAGHALIADRVAAFLKAY